MKNPDIKTSILQMLATKGDGRTFAEFESIPGFSGNIGLETSTENLFLWFSCSPEAVQVVCELLQEQMITIKTTSVLTYQADGLLPRYKTGSEGAGYKKPRWLPVAIYKGPKFG